MVILNFKTYPEAVGKNVDRLLTAILEVSSALPHFQSQIFVAPSTLELLVIKQTYPQLNLVAQHADNVLPGQTTGWIPAKQLADAGMEYTLLNHAEHRLNPNQLASTVSEIQSAGLKAIVCVESLAEAEALRSSEPFAIALEHKDLIATGNSISQVRVDAVSEFIQNVSSWTTPIIGAGIADGGDIKSGKELGAKGYILSSRFVKAEDPAAKLTELLNNL